MKLSVLMPVYNECATLREILKRVRAVPIEKELVLVDNCSTDGTRELLQEMLARGEAGSRRRLEAKRHSGNLLRVICRNGTKAKVRASDVLWRRRAVSGSSCRTPTLEYDPQDYLKLLAAHKSGKRRRDAKGEMSPYLERVCPWLLAARNQLQDAFLVGRIGLSVAFRVLYALSLSDVATCYKLMRRAWRKVSIAGRWLRSRF
jgi:hypothetical protein